MSRLTYATRLRCARVEAGLSQKVLTQRLNVSLSTVKAWENCQRDIRPKYSEGTTAVLQTPALYDAVDSFGVNLARMMAERGLTIKTLSDKTGISEITVNTYLSQDGKYACVPSWDMSTLCTLFAVKPEELLGSSKNTSRFLSKVLLVDSTFDRLFDELNPQNKKQTLAYMRGLLSTQK